LSFASDGWFRHLCSQELWPAARTCTHQLRLPAYASKAELEKNLLAAMEHGTGFGND